MKLRIMTQTVDFFTGEIAVQSMGKRAKKRFAEAQRRDEEEKRELAERILKQKLDFEAAKKKKEADEKKLAKKLAKEQKKQA